MTGKRPMFLFYFSITLAIASSALYHFTQRQIPAGANPAVSIIVTYVVSLILCVVLSFFLPSENGFGAEVKRLNWASYVLAPSLVNIIGILVCLAGFVMLNWKR